MAYLTANEWLSEKANDRFVLAMVIASIFHAALILGVSFGVFDDRPSQLPENIEVTLVNTQTEKAPDKIDFYAQANQEGGGNISEKIRPQTLFPSILPDPQVKMASEQTNMATPANRKASEKQLITASIADEAIFVQDELAKEKKSKTLSAVELYSRSMNIASLEAEIGQEMQAYANMPKRKTISAATAKHKYASYMDSWRRVVERVGNNNYPQEALRRKLEGDLLMQVVINANGTIKELSILRSSGHSVLDDASKRIVHLAAPFAPLPKEILKEIDELAIIRTWQWSSGNVTAR